MPTSIERGDGVATVVVSGDVDLATAPAMERTIDEAIAADGVDAVVVDLTGVGFLDSSGIAALLKGRRLADRRGATFRVTGARGMVRRIFELSGVWEHLCGDD